MNLLELFDFILTSVILFFCAKPSKVKMLMCSTFQIFWNKAWCEHRNLQRSLFELHMGDLFMSCGEGNKSTCTVQYKFLHVDYNVLW